MKNLLNIYKKEAIPKLKKELGVDNLMALPRIEKVIVNIGINQDKKNPEYLKTINNTLERITGQKSVITKAKKSISSFKIREGMEIGRKVTLRGKMMYDFLNKLIGVTFPRTRDFRGLSLKAVDRQGNLSIGIKEHIVFPEIKADEVERIHGLEVSIVTSAKNKKFAESLFYILGFPFAEKNKYSAKGGSTSDKK